MSKRKLLLVDGDARSRRVLEVSLRSEGFAVATASEGGEALARCSAVEPDLVLTETRLSGMDGFEFVRQLKLLPQFAQTPVVFLSNQKSVADKIRGLELGVEDYLTKPIFVRELIARIHMLLVRRTHDRLAMGGSADAQAPFTGSLEDLGVVDLLQTLNSSRRTGAVKIRSGRHHAVLYFRDGEVIDAELARLRGEEAVFRALTWHSGEFDVDLCEVERPDVVGKPLQGLLMEGMRRVDEWARLTGELPALSSVVQVDHTALATRLPQVPDELEGILGLVDGSKTLLQVIDESPYDDLSTASVIAKLHREGLIRIVGASAARGPRSNLVVPRSSLPQNALNWGAGTLAQGSVAPAVVTRTAAEVAAEVSGSRAPATLPPPGVHSEPLEAQALRPATLPPAPLSFAQVAPAPPPAAAFSSGLPAQQPAASAVAPAGALPRGTPVPPAIASALAQLPEPTPESRRRVSFEPAMGSESSPPGAVTEKDLEELLADARAVQRTPEERARQRRGLFGVVAVVLLALVLLVVGLLRNRGGEDIASVAPGAPPAVQPSAVPPPPSASAAVPAAPAEPEPIPSAEPVSSADTISKHSATATTKAGPSAPAAPRPTTPPPPPPAVRAPAPPPLATAPQKAPPTAVFPE